MKRHRTGEQKVTTERGRPAEFKHGASQEGGREKGSKSERGTKTVGAILTSWMIFLCSLERLGGKHLTWDFESFMKSLSSFLRASSSTTLSRAKRMEQSKVQVCVCACICMCMYVYVLYWSSEHNMPDVRCQMSTTATHTTQYMYVQCTAPSLFLYVSYSVNIRLSVCTYIHTYSLIRF